MREILAAIRERGDTAVREYSAKFDGLSEDCPLLVSRQEMQQRGSRRAKSCSAAMHLAQANIRAFAERQLPHAWSFRPTTGMEVGQIIRSISSVGCYVPGGRYPLPSTLLMTVTPAQVAGVERIVVCSPKPAQETLAAAYLCGIIEFYRIGGAQAIAASPSAQTRSRPSTKSSDRAIYTSPQPRPSSQQRPESTCPPGPTEIVVTSEAGDPNGIAADLVAQAEHDPEALAIFIT